MKIKIKSRLDEMPGREHHPPVGAGLPRDGF